MKANDLQANGWQLSRVTASPEVAARTWASRQVVSITRARLSRFSLLHAGVTSLKMVGSSVICGAYQARPNPSPLSGSSRSWLWKLWWMIELAGSVTRELTRIGEPR